MKELEKIEPFMWLQIKPNEVKAKITCVMPAGSDFNHPYNRYEIEFTGGEKLVIKEGLLRDIFGFTGIMGQHNESLNEALARVEKENEEKAKLADGEKSLLVAEAKELGIKSSHLMSIEKLKEKITELKG